MLIKHIFRLIHNNQLASAQTIFAQNLNAMELFSLVGNLAARLTTISFLPQAIKTIKSRDTQQLSLPMYLMFVAGVALWIVYGLHVKSTPIIVGNVITFMLAGSILMVKIKSTFGSRRG